MLAYPKFRLTPDEQQEILSEYLPWCEAVNDVPASTLPDLRDRADQSFLDLAIGGRAQLLVTGDAGLLALASKFPIPIVTGREFVRAVESYPCDPARPG